MCVDEYEARYRGACPSAGAGDGGADGGDAAADGDAAGADAAPAPLVRLASAQSPRCLALDADHLYWQNANGLVVGAAKAGGHLEASHFQTPAADDPRCGMAVDGGYLFATSYGLGKILRLSLSSNGAWTIGADGALYGQLAGPAALAVDDAWVYVAEYDGGRVTRLPKDPRALPDGDADAAEVLASGLVHPFAIAVDADHVYWLERGDEKTQIGAVRTIAKSGAGGPSITLASDQLALGALALYGSRLFYTRATGEIMVVDKNGTGAAAPLVTGQDMPGSVATDGEHLFFGTTDRVRQARISDGRPWSLYQASTPLVAVDDARVFFTFLDEVWSAGKSSCPACGE